MLPILDSGIYNTTQFIDWQIDHYASHMTVPETGLGFRLGTPSSGFTSSGMSGAANSATYMESNSVPVFTTSGGAWKYGRSANVVDHWESGAPIGITKARFSVLHWRGYLTSDFSWLSKAVTGQFWLGFSGKGTVKVVYDGSTILNETLSDTQIKYTSIQSGSGGEQLDIYYWQLGEPWGGIVGKFIPQEDINDTTPNNEEYREAPVISASLFPYTTATATTLPQVSTATIEASDPTSVSVLRFTLPLITSDNSIGWSLLTSPRRVQHYDGATTITLKRGQLIKFYGGFQGETYSRFTGNITNIEESKGIITITCESVESRLTTINVENYPDKTSYCTFAYFETETSSNPVHNIEAYDFWPLEYVIKDLCHRGGIDSRLFYGTKKYELNNTATTKVDHKGALIDYD